MPTIAYLANLFPANSEPYVVDEIRALRSRGVTVIPCSIRRCHFDRPNSWIAETVYFWQPIQILAALQALSLCLNKINLLGKFVRRILFRGNETLSKRARTLAHTFLGAYYAILLRKFEVQHIHVHHGYFGSWVAMVAARLLGIDFSMTLHGSDLLLHSAYLDLKLELCKTCFTISEFNRNHILDNHPEVDPRKVVVQRLGVECSDTSAQRKDHDASVLVILTAGRLHAIKDQRLLVHACAALKARKLSFRCLIAGEGPERRHLERLIRDLGLQDQVHLLGHVPAENMADYYRRADLVVLTSRSEGIPLVLMEAMAHQQIVLAPSLTGIPELIVDGKTGFLYRPGSVESFVDRVEMIHNNEPRLEGIRHAGKERIRQHFDKQKNLGAFCDRLLAIAGFASERSATAYTEDQQVCYENPVLQ